MNKVIGVGLTFDVTTTRRSKERQGKREQDG